MTYGCGTENFYKAEDSPHIGRQTIRCPVCGSPWCDNPEHGTQFILG